MTDDASERPFARIRLSGERFSGGRLPVNALAEIQRYQAVVLEAARREWLEAHPDRELPEGFDAALGLVITDVEDGSAQVLLERPSIADLDEYFERGRDDFEQNLTAIFDLDESVTEAPLFGLKDFQAFGTSLINGDAIEVTSYTRDARPASTTSFTKEELSDVIAPRQKELKRVNDRLRRQARHVEDRAVAGRLVELNPEKRSFQLDTLHYQVITGWYKNSDITEDLRNVLNASTKAPVVRVRGDLQFRGGKVWRLWDATEVELLEIDGHPWSRKLVELASLTPDWDGEVPGAEMISFTALDAARDLMLRFSEAEVARPSIFPTEDGGVSLEWASSTSVSTIEIGPDAEFILFNLPEGSNQGTEQSTADLERAVLFGIEVAH